uniref:Uncharacterized protein n=1 Tax=Anthurium amnicola TaxID=1678845 RepID=A0A1D1YP21_9ARAE
MKKFTPLTFFAVALLFLITISSVSAHNTCSKESYYKRNVLGKRTNDKKCPCALAKAIFDDKVVGLVVLTQDECGETTNTGFFSKGLDDPQKNNFTFAITDDCGKVLHNLGTLDAVFADGGTKVFSKKFDFNLNCDKDGILLQKSAKYSKRTNECKKTYYKRQATDGTTKFSIESNGDPYSSADIF